MTDERILMLIEERDRAKRALAVAERHLSHALTEYSRERNYLWKLTPEQAARQMQKVA